MPKPEKKTEDLMDQMKAQYEELTARKVELEAELADTVKKLNAVVAYRVAMGEMEAPVKAKRGRKPKGEAEV